MTILSDKEILYLCENDDMISPYQTCSIKECDGKKIISYGLSSYGVDLSLADEFKVLTPKSDNSCPTYTKDFTGSKWILLNKYMDCGYIDPKNMENYKDIYEIKGDDYCIIPPNSFALGRSIEYIKMPRDVTGLATNKSTYARCGLNTPSTVLEAGWQGHLTIEMFNSTPHPIKVYANEGIVQILFFKGEDCLTSYADRKGKYQGQKGITNAKI